MYIKRIQHRLVKFFRALSVSISRGEINQGSIVIAYYALFSLFPMIIIVGNVLPLFHIDTTPIAQYLSVILPDKVAGFIMPIVDSLLKQHSNGYISFGVILAAWSVSGLVNAVRIGMNRVYGVHDAEIGQPFWYTLINRGLIILISSVMIFLFAIIVFAFAFGQQIIEFLAPIFNLQITGIERIFNYRWTVITIVMIIVVSYSYIILPNVSHKRRSIFPGVMTTVGSWLLLSYLFGLYFRNFKISWENYGVIGTLIMFMLWLNIGAMLLLVGAAVNAAIDDIRLGPSNYTGGRLNDYLKNRRNGSR